MTRCCVVTGANGLLGRHLCERLARAGWEVRGLVRDPARDPFDDRRIRLFACDLPEHVDASAFEGASVVIHAAYMSRHTTLEEARAVNEEGTARVLELSRASGARRFVFISSTGAHEDALSYYGRSKLLIESRLDLTRDLVIRPGLILGHGGLFERISSSLRRFGLVPVFDGGRQRIQTVHVDDLAAAIVRAVELDLTGRYVIAHPEPIQLRDLFREIGLRMDRRVRLVPLPAGPLAAVLRAAERLGLRLPLTSENVLGAISLRSQPSEYDVERVGVPIRSTSESLDDLIGVR